MKTEVRINNSQKLFVIPCGRGFSCLGFDVCDGETRQLAKVLDSQDPIPEPGTIEQYLHRRKLVGQIGSRDLGTWFSPGTPPDVQRTLEFVRKAGERIRIFYGDTATGRDWQEEFDVIGYVRRSMGPLKVPILIGRKDGHGGGAILTANIVRVIWIKNRCELYRHPDYNEPEFKIETGQDQRRPFRVISRGSLEARFEDRKKAERYIAFMRGDRFSQ